MATVQTIKVTLQRDSLQTPWGFRLQGGADFRTPFAVNKVKGEERRSEIVVVVFVLDHRWNACRWTFASRRRDFRDRSSTGRCDVSFGSVGLGATGRWPNHLSHSEVKSRRRRRRSATVRWKCCRGGAGANVSAAAAPHPRPLSALSWSYANNHSAWSPTSPGATGGYNPSVISSADAFFTPVLRLSVVLSKSTFGTNSRTETGVEVRRVTHSAPHLCRA